MVRKEPTQQEIRDRLDRLAGDPAIVDAALRDLTDERGQPPTLRELMREVLRRRIASRPREEPAPA
jgi:hypothetical protein